MANQTKPIVLGYDGSRWTSGEIEAEIQSMSEPDRKVPLTMQLVGTPDIFAFSLADGSDKALARVSLKADAVVPPDCRGTIEIIADPATEAMMGVMQALSPIALPKLTLPKMRATVEVHLVPFDLRLRWNDAEVSSGQTVSLDGDGKSVGKLVAEVYRVDGRGNPSGEPVPAQFKLVENFKEADWVSLSQSSGTTFTAELTSRKLCLDKAAKELGTLRVEATIDGRTLQRVVSLRLAPLSVQLIGPKLTELKSGETTTIEVVVSNSRGEGVAAVAVAFKTNPELGSLAPARGSSDGEGRVRVVYTAPANDLLAADKTPLTIEATVGPEGEWQGQVFLTLLYSKTVTVSFSKLGFADVSQSFELTAPGPLTVACSLAEYDLPAAYVTASLNEAHAASDAQGSLSLAVGGTGPGSSGQIKLALSGDCKALMARLEQDLGQLTQPDVSTSNLDRAQDRVKKFVHEDFIKRLAAEPEESFEVTMVNLRMIAGVVRVGVASRGLLRRRYAHFQAQMEAFLVNLMGAIFSVFGEKIFKKLADFIGSAARKMFGWLSTKISGSPRLMGWVKSGTTRLKDLVSAIDDKIAALRNRVKANKVPEEISGKMPLRPDDGPFKHEPGSLLKTEGFKQGLKDATLALKKQKHLLGEAEIAARKAREAVSSLTKKLGEAERHLAASSKANTLEKWQATIKQLKAELGTATSSVAEKEAALKTAAQQFEQAGKALAEAEGAAQSAGVLDALLEAITSCFNRLVLTGQLVMAWFTVKALEQSDEVLKKVIQQWHPHLNASLADIIKDKVYKPLFAMATGGTCAYGMGKLIDFALCLMHSNGMATTLDDVLIRAGRWADYDRETLKEATRFYYEQLDAASFQEESSEVWVEYVADVLDWLEFLMVWSVRVVNVVIGILSLLAAAVSFGASLVAWLAFRAGVAVYTELMDTIWDCLKAVGRGLTAAAGFYEVMGVLLPAHAAYAARLYSDDSLYQSANNGWSLPLDERWHQRMSSLPKKVPESVRKMMLKVEALELKETFPVKVVEAVKDTDAASPFRGGD